MGRRFFMQHLHLFQARLNLMTSFWNLERISSLLTLEITSPIQIKKNLEISHLTTDSRTVTTGCLFIAIKGDNYDGHHFISQAIDKGAIAILCETLPDTALPLKDGIIYFQVHSTLNAIRTLAHAYRKQFQIPVIGVVGSVGKTTTKELISSILLGKFEQVHKTEGSQNGFLGIPLTLLQMQASTQIAVIEIGIDDIGAMEQHLTLVEPTHLILTAIGPEHLHQLKTVEIAAEEELKAFDYALKNHLPIAINLSDPYVQKWYKKNQHLLTSTNNCTYALHQNQVADYCAHYSPQSSTLTIHHENEKITFPLPLPGEHHAHNLLAAITLCTFFQLTHEEMKNGLSQFKTAYGRTEIYQFKDNIEIIGDYYNSNPTSIVAGIKLLTEKTNAGTTLAVLGDMLELGEQEESFHREIAATLIHEKINSILLFGNRMKWLQDELKNNGITALHFLTHTALTQHLLNIIKPNDRILIKGSRGMKMETILKELQQKLPKAD